MARWREEVILCQTDLECCERYFQHQRAKWETRRDTGRAQRKRGKVCYAEKQMAMWQDLERRAHAAVDFTSKKISGIDLK